MNPLGCFSVIFKNAPNEPFSGFLRGRTCISENHPQTDAKPCEGVSRSCMDYHPVPENPGPAAQLSEVEFTVPQFLRHMVSDRLFLGFSWVYCVLKPS